MIMSTKSENKRVEMVFPRPKREMDVHLPRAKGESFFQIFSTDIDKIAEWFNQYEIDSLELKIDNIIETPDTTKLLVGSKAENGLKVVLKPKAKTTSSSNRSLSQIQQDIKGVV